jgi:hypothetical protein
MKKLRWTSVFFNTFSQGCSAGYTQPGRAFNVAIRKFPEWNKLAILFFFWVLWLAIVLNQE